MFVFLLITPCFWDFIDGINTTNISNLVVTSDDLGLCGTSLINDELHFIYISDHKDETDLIHFVVENDKVIKKTIIVDNSFSLGKKYFYTASSNQSFYFAYGISIENTPEYDNHQYSCYYYNSASNEGETIFLADVSYYHNLDLEYSTPHILGVNVLDNDQAIFLLNSYSITKNTTDIITINLNQLTNTTNVFVEPGKLEDVSSCYNSNNNSAYFLYFETGEDKYRLYEYDFLSHSLTNYNCSFSHTNYLIRGGRLLFDQITEKLYLICTLHGSSNSPTEFALFEYNSTSSTFNLTSVTGSAYATLDTRIDPYVNFYTDNEHDDFDALIINSQLSIIYRKSVAHTELRQLALINYSLDNNDDWNYFDLVLDSNQNPIHSRFIYDFASETYLDSYLIGYSYQDHSPYHSFGGENKIVSSLGICGSFVTDFNNPYSIRTIKSSNYWLIIASSIVIPLTLGGFCYYYIHRYKQKRTSREEN